MNKTPENICPSDELENSDRQQKLDHYIKIMLSGETDLCGVLVSGYPGIGKTYFVESYLNNCRSHYPVLVARHRQQHSDIPYFGLKLAISDFLTEKYNEYSRKDFEKFTTSLKSYFGDIFPLFLEYIPEMSLIVGEDYEISRNYIPKVENQLFALFKTFFSYLNHYYNAPIFFFTDDLQWIDTSGTGLLKYLLLELSPDKFVWIASCRGDSYNSFLYFQLIEQLGINKKRVETIYLKQFTENEVKRIVESTLVGECHPALARVCFELCAGNPSYLQVLLESIKNTDYIWQDDGMWYCDVNAIAKYYQGQGKEQILFERLVNISEPTRMILYMMACMGGYNHRVLIDALHGDESGLTNRLNEAEESGFIKKSHDLYSFSENHIGEMIYENLPLKERAKIHYDIAKLLYNIGLNELNVTQMVLMTTQFNQSLNLVRHFGEQQLCAELNYLAGQHSRQDNALNQAQYFFKISADLLKECVWEEVEGKVYLVNMERAHIEYQLGGHDLAEIHLDYLLEHITDPLKRVNIYELKVIINNHLGRFRKAVLILQECLRELNIELPLDEKILENEIGSLKILLDGQQKNKEKLTYSNKQIKKQKAILKLLYVGGMSLHHTSDVLMKWAALQIITRSGTDSTSGEKAIGYVSYGRMLIIDGHIDKGFDYGNKGLEINNLLKDVTLRCRVYGVYAFYIQPWKKAYAESVYLLDKADEAGEKAGDLIGRYILKTHKLNIHILSGLPLHELDSLEFEEIHPDTELTYYITLYQKNFIKFLKGESDIFSIAHHKPSRLAAKFTIQEETFYRNYVKARYYLLFGYYELAERSAHEADINRKLQEGSPILPANLMLWFFSITQNWHNYKTKDQEKLKVHITKILHQFELWSQHAPDNYASSYWLQQAEFHRISGTYDEIDQYYTHAIKITKNNLYNKAMGCEFYAKYLLSVGYVKKAQKYLLQSLESYEEWGALAKVKQLIQQYHPVLPKTDNHAPEINIEMIQHEFSGDLEVRSLVSKLMVLLLRISGSTRVVIESAMDNGDLSRLGDFALFDKIKRNESNDVPLGLILLAHRSQNQMVVNDLKTSNKLGEPGDFSDRGIKSFFIFPVTIRNDLSLVIYLENSFAKNGFTPEIIRWVRITANQGSVIIENARIHELTMKLNKDLRQEMKAKERLTAVIQEQKNSHLHALVQAQDDERKRIARDLHDSLGSLLSTVKLRFNGLQQDVSGHNKNRSDKFDDALNLVDDAVDELRRIAHNMLPVALTKFGLKAALGTFVENIQLSESLEVDFQVLGFEKRIPEDTEVSVYRICQELVQNVLKHAQADFMRLQIIDHGDLINLIVEDNGKGMDQHKIVHGFGFHTIESKVKFLKGTFNIESSPGAGTMILINIPKS